MVGKAASTVVVPIVILDYVRGSLNVSSFMRAVYNHTNDALCAQFIFVQSTYQTKVPIEKKLQY